MRDAARLSSFLVERGRLPEAEVVRIVRGILEQLEAMHATARGHGRLSLSAVELDAAGGVRLRSPSTTTGACPAPEGTGEATPAADMWAVGLLAYELATGELAPRDAAPSWRADLTGIESPRLFALILTCTVTDPGDRLRDAREGLAVLGGDGLLVGERRTRHRWWRAVAGLTSLAMLQAWSAASWWSRVG